MTHPFQDKLIVFIGTPLRCSRQEAVNAVIAVGGIPDDAVTAHTDFAVALNRSDSTKVYAKAVKNARYGLLRILGEEQFFNILENRAQPPAPTPPDSGIFVIPATDKAASEGQSAQAMDDVRTRKRIRNMERYGIELPEDHPMAGHVTIDMKPLKIMGIMAKEQKRRKERPE